MREKYIDIIVNLILSNAVLILILISIIFQVATKIGKVINGNFKQRNLEAKEIELNKKLLKGWDVKMTNKEVKTWINENECNYFNVIGTIFDKEELEDFLNNCDNIDIFDDFILEATAKFNDRIKVYAVDDWQRNIECMFIREVLEESDTFIVKNLYNDEDVEFINLKQVVDLVVNNKAKYLNVDSFLITDKYGNSRSVEVW